MSTLSGQQGPWLPLRGGMPVPADDFDSDPLVHLCVNETWIPSVLTALKLLARPEAWIGTRAEVLSVCEQAHTLMGQFTLGCDFPPPIPNWHLEYTLDSGQIDPLAWATPVIGDDGTGNPTLTYDIVIWPTTAFPPDITIRGRDNASGDLVGGDFLDVTIRNQIDPAGQTYVLTTVDCLGGTVVHSDFTPRSYSGTFRTLRFTTGNATVYFLKLTIRGNWICTVA